MQKFRCEKCGHRIAIQQRHLGTLVTCPECGNLTHPLAEKIIERTPVTVAAATESSRSCENCGRAIGRLETPQLFERSVVCLACFRSLSDSSESAVLTRDEPVERIDRDTALLPVIVSRKPRTELTASETSSDRPVVPRLGLRVPRGPLRVILWLVVVGLAIWFVLNVVQVINGLVSVAIVGFLLLTTLWVLYQGGMNDVEARMRKDRDDSDHGE